MESAQPAVPCLHYTMTLFITGATRLSLLAVEKVQAFCDEELTGMYDLEVVDLYRSPERAASAQVVAAPTLIRQNP
jgi:circadian clock protein KaiB